MQFGDGENLEVRNVVWEFRNRNGKVQGVPRKLAAGNKPISPRNGEIAAGNEPTGNIGRKGTCSGQ